MLGMNFSLLRAPFLPLPPIPDRGINKNHPLKFNSKYVKTEYAVRSESRVAVWVANTFHPALLFSSPFSIFLFSPPYSDTPINLPPLHSRLLEQNFEFYNAVGLSEFWCNVSEIKEASWMGFVMIKQSKINLQLWGFSRTNNGFLGLGFECTALGLGLCVLTLTALRC